MGLIRLLLYGALIWLLYRLVKGLLPGGGAAGQRTRRAPPGGRPDRLDGGELVQDPVCGVYVPKATAVRGPDGHFFCSPACRDAYGQKPG
jgi:YHS domain-containing protein